MESEMKLYLKYKTYWVAFKVDGKIHRKSTWIKHNENAVDVSRTVAKKVGKRLMENFLDGKNYEK